MKVCAKCGEEKPFTEEYWFNDKTRKDGYYPYCKPCRRRDNKASYDRTGKDRYQKKRVWLNELKNHPCEDCERKFPPECMDFDHRQGEKKSFNIGSKLPSRSKERILEEIEKCDLVCANCHRMRTYAGA
jgi:hypothetical protein